MSQSNSANPVLKLIVVSALAIAMTTLASSSTRAQRPPTLVSGTSPFPAGCATSPDSSETNYENAEVEPWIAVDPSNADHLIGVWQQDRWQFGGAHGLMTGVSWDGGLTWERTFAHFSKCAGGTAANGGNYERATDPWVTISPSRVAFQISDSFDVSDPNQAILVSRSFDGGGTWSEPDTLLLDTDPLVTDDKESITADPEDSRFVYAVWDRLVFDTNFNVLAGPTWFARTTVGGASWEPARVIFDPGPGNQTISNQIVVLPNGILVNMFTLITNANSLTPFVSTAVIRSRDKGLTWSKPITINSQEPIGVVDPKTGEPLRTGAIVPAITVNRETGALFVVWEDARFSGGLREGIAFSKSTDGGLHWTTPVQINKVPAVQAFTPSIAVGDDGRISVTYYDFRNDTADPNVLLTNYWRITTPNGGQTWHEVPVAGPFDMRTAPISTGFFVGDYEGIVPTEESFTPIYVLANSGNTSNRTDVFVTSQEEEGDTSWNGHEERNDHPQSPKEMAKSHRERHRPD